jgi:hypothetical protein
MFSPDQSLTKYRGMRLSDAPPILIIGYIVLAVGALVLVFMVQFTIFFCCVRERKMTQEELDDAHQLSQFYDGRLGHGED